MPPKCCLRNDSGRCKSCSCVRNGRPCLNCAPGAHDRCLNIGLSNSCPADVGLSSAAPSAAPLHLSEALASLLHPLSPSKPVVYRRKKGALKEMLASDNNSGCRKGDVFAGASVGLGAGGGAGGGACKTSSRASGATATATVTLSPTVTDVTDSSDMVTNGFDLDPNDSVTGGAGVNVAPQVQPSLPQTNNRDHGQPSCRPSSAPTTGQPQALPTFTPASSKAFKWAPSMDLVSVIRLRQCVPKLFTGGATFSMSLLVRRAGSFVVSWCVFYSVIVMAPHRNRLL